MASRYWPTVFRVMRYALLRKDSIELVALRSVRNFFGRVAAAIETNPHPQKTPNTLKK